MMFQGNLLRQEREQAKLTQATLAQGICTPSMISQIESGKARPSEKLVAKLADKLTYRPISSTSSR